MRPGQTHVGSEAEVGDVHSAGAEQGGPRESARVVDVVVLERNLGLLPPVGVTEPGEGRFER